MVTSTEGFDNKLLDLFITLDEVEILKLSERCRDISDGSGVHLVTQKMEAYLHSLYSLETNDLEIILEWRNEPSVREYMHTHNIITLGFVTK